MNKFLSFTPYPTSNEGLRQSVIALKTSFRHLLVWVVMFVGLIPFSSAQTNCSSPDRLIFSGSYDCVTIGNTMSLSEDKTNCALLPSTSQTLTIPAGATIKAAYLFWSASGYIDHIVKLNGKQAVAEKTFIYSLQNAGFGGYDGFFGCRANVTNIVTGSGSYTLTDLSANTEALCGGNAVYAGWAMVVVYEQANLPTTNIHIINDKFDYTFLGSNTTTLNCINVPTNCVSNAKLTIVAFEGDAYKGERLTIGGTLWPDGNTFRGQSGPNLDIVNFDVSDKIIPGTTSLTYKIEAYNVQTVWGPASEGLFDFVKILKYNTCQTPPPPVLCADGSPKKTPGAACNDNNPNTTNDVIQADGCGCAGTVPPPAICQQACTPIPVVRYKAPGCGGMLPIYPGATGFSNVTAGGFVKGSATEYNCYYSNDPYNYTPSAMGVNTSHFASPFYDWGVRFTATLTPTQIGSITGLKILQRTLAGGSISNIDPNTCSPTKYAVRVLKDGQVVHEQIDVPLVNTTGSVGPTGYYYLNIDLSQVAALKFTQTTNFEFQLVAYDLSCKFNEFMTNGKGYWHFDTVELLACNQAGFSVTATNDGPKCNQPITLTATAAGATTYKWSGPNGYTATGATATATASGTYTITATSASGCTTTSSTVVVNTAKTPGTACNDNNPNTTNDVIQADGCNCAGTVVPKGSIGDMTYCDNNANGVMDNGDTPQSGVQIQLCNASNVIIATATTDAQGKYLFSNLAAGIYVVKFPSTITGGKTITTTNPITVNLTAGQNYLDADAGYKPVVATCPDGSPKKTPGTACNDNNPNTTNDVIQADGCTCAGTTTTVKGSIGDFTFNDNNNNGIYDTGDTPKSSILVTLCNSAGQTISTTLSVNGLYSFGNLAAGTYIVKFPAVHTDGKSLTTPQQITVNLTAGQNFVNADAGYNFTTSPKGSIGDLVFCDNNNNRIYDSGDTPISGVTVTLCNSSNVVITTTTTNTSGNYSFGSLAAGNYIVKFPATLTDGKAITTTNPINVSLTAGQNYTNADAGYYKPTSTTGSIGDFTFNDNNNNGIYDTGDTPKSNILVTLCNSAGQTISTTLSVSGNYLFGNLPAGTYIVKFPAVHTDGKSLTTPQQITVNLAAGQNYTSADAGYNFSTSPLGSIGDFVFCDNNNNRVFDNGDTPISGVTVTLCNSSNVVLSTTTTNSAGNYTFGSLAAGSYIVKFPATLTDGKAITTTNPITVNLTAGQNYTNADAGYYKATSATGSIGDFTFNDNNNNGIYDTGDTPKSSILVTLCNSAGQTITTTLSVNGLYSFGNLAAGTYIVKFPAVHTDGKSLTTPQQITVNLAAGQNYVNADAGYYKPTVSVCSIGDFVFCDNNNNRVFDSGDTPISGVTVTLCNSSNVVITTTTTNTSGNYSFTNLAAGTYIVKFPTTLTDGKAITTTNPITVNLTTGQNYTNADAGYYKPSTGGTSSIKDVFVFCDNNKNQIYDAGDAPIQGVTVTLCNASNQVITTAITNADGAYSFLNLAAGTYIVKFPATLADGKAITTTNPITITLGTGETSSAADAGYYKPATLDCNATRDNSITRTCSNNIPVLTGTALAGYEYQWLSSTSVCPNNTSQAIAGATGQNYTLPSNVSQTTYFMRCARPIGCTSWDAVTESNCLTVNASDCTPSGTKCDAVIVKGNTDGTISVTGLGSYTSFVQVFNNLWQSVSNQEYSQSSVSIPVKNGTYSVNVLLYDASNGGWIFLCEKTVSVVVTGGVAALSKNTILDINAFAEAQRAQIQWVNNTGSQNDFFTVEKLNNTSGNFEKIEIVNSKPTEGNEVYNVYDNAITDGDNTYRVQLTMLDGQVKTSALKTLTYKNLNDVRIYPNPASDYIEVDLKQYEGKKVSLYIYNQVGKIVHTQQIERASATPIHLDIDRQTSGQMLLRVMAEGRREVTKKFIIQN